MGGFGKKAGQDLVKGMASGIDAGKAQLEAATAKIASLHDREKDAIGKLRVAQEKLNEARTKGATGSQLATAEERYQTALRKSTVATNTHKTALNEVEVLRKRMSTGGLNVDNDVRAIGRLSQAMSGLSRLGERGLSSAGFSGASGALSRLTTGLGDAGTAAAGMESSVAAAGAVAGGAAAAGIAVLAVGLGVAVKNLYDLGSSFDETFDNIRIKTGATGKRLTELEDATKRIAAGVPLGMGDIGNTVATVNQALGLTGANLDNVAKNVANLGRLTGEQVDVRKLGQTFRAFKIDPKDQVDALNQLFQTWQATGVGINEQATLLTSKGGRALRQFGLDLGQSATLMQQFEAAGVPAEDAMTSLGLALSKFAKAGKDPGVGLRETTDQIKTLLDAGKQAEAEQLGVKTFGKAWTAVFEGIQSGQFNLDDLSKGLASNGDTIQKAADQTDDFAQRWQEFKNQIGAALEPIATPLFNTIQETLTKFADWIQAHEPQIIGFFTTMGSGATEFVSGWIAAGADVVDVFAKIVNGIGDMAGGILTGKAAIDDFFGDHQAADSARSQAAAMFNLGHSLYSLRDTMRASSDQWQHWSDGINDAGGRAQEAAKLTADLGKATVSLPDGKTITISDNSPETLAKLDKIGVTVEQLPDGSFQVVPKTDQGTAILNAWRDQQNNVPIKPPLEPLIRPEAIQMAVDNASQHLNLNIPLVGLGAQGPPVLPAPPGSNLIGPAGHAFGGATYGPGPRGRDSFQIVVAGGEHVFTEPEVNAAGGHGAMYAIRAAIRAGARYSGGFETGGPVGLTRDMVDQLATTQFGLDLGSGDRSEPGSYHNIHGGARDYNSPDKAKLMQFAQYMAQTYGPYLDELIFDYPGFTQTIKDGEVKGAFGQFYTMQQAGYHGDHVHIAFGKHAATFAGGAPGAAAQNLSPQDQSVAAIIAEGRRRGYSDADLAQVVADARLESGLNPEVTNSIGRHGLFQQDEGYPGRGSMQGQVSGFFDRLQGTQGATIGQRIVGVEKGGYGPEAFAQFVPQSQNDIARLSSMNTLGGPAAATVAGNVVDPKAVRDSQQKVADADERVRQADAQVSEAEARRSELKADAEQSQKLAADETVRKAKVDADKARREATDARTDLQTVQQGKPGGKDATGGTGGTGGGAGGKDDLGPLGSIAGSFLKETFGFDGTLFPDPSQLGVVKLFNAILGIKYTPQGKGFPWQTGYPGGDGTPGSGSPFGDPILGGGGGGIGGLLGGLTGMSNIKNVTETSGLPFGMLPNAAPTPGGGDAGLIPTVGGPGTPFGPPPGPPGVVNIDQSTTVNSPTGNTDDLERRIRQSHLNTPRVDTYVQPGG